MTGRWLRSRSEGLCRGVRLAAQPPVAAAFRQQKASSALAASVLHLRLLQPRSRLPLSHFSQWSRLAQNFLESSEVASASVAACRPAEAWWREDGC